MAKLSAINKNNKRIKLSDKLYKKRNELKKIIMNKSLTFEERFRAQGFNDFIVFSIQATASLTAGIVLSFTSWKIMNILCIPFLIIIIFTTLRADRFLDKTN